MVLLRFHRLTTRSIVICAWLILGGRENRGSIAKLNLVRIAQFEELPLDELVVVWVGVRGNERTSPVHFQTKLLQMLLANGWEMRQPLVRILELGDIRIAQLKLGHNLPLILFLRTFGR